MACQFAKKTVKPVKNNRYRNKDRKREKHRRLNCVLAYLTACLPCTIRVSFRMFKRQYDSERLKKNRVYLIIFVKRNEDVYIYASTYVWFERN